jgi:hypothetical protein
MKAKSPKFKTGACLLAGISKSLCPTAVTPAELSEQRSNLFGKRHLDISCADQSVETQVTVTATESFPQFPLSDATTGAPMAIAYTGAQVMRLGSSSNSNSGSWLNAAVGQAHRPFSVVTSNMFCPI